MTQWRFLIVEFDVKMMLGMSMNDENVTWKHEQMTRKKSTNNENVPPTELSF